LNLLWNPSEAAQREIEAQPREDEQWWASIPEHLRPLFDSEIAHQVLLSTPRCPVPELVEAIESYRRLDDLADDYYELLDRLNLRGDETVVEVGADSCWGARDLSRRAAFVVATDITTHLEMGQAFLDAGADFERVRCEMACFPFRDGSLDLVFGVACLHHCAPMEKVLLAVRRALKPGGRAVFFDEPVRGRFDLKAKDAFGAERRELGFQEHIYTVKEYFDAARATGFVPRVAPLTSVLKDPRRKWPLARQVALALLRTGLGRTGVFTRWVYPWLLQFYPRIPFPRFALVLEKK
jgi:SAM-dependent methyltransferase